MLAPDPVHKITPATASGGLAELDKFLGQLDTKLRARNERLMRRLLAWGELLDAAGWCVALAQPAGGGLWLSDLAQQDLRKQGDLPPSWNDLIGGMNGIPAAAIHRRGEGVLIWSGRSSAPPRVRPQANLTKRETEVMTWLREGKTTSEIAIILGCAVRTVEKHLANLYQKTGAGSRAALLLNNPDSLS